MAERRWRGEAPWGCTHGPRAGERGAGCKPEQLANARKDPQPVARGFAGGIGPPEAAVSRCPGPAPRGEEPGRTSG